MKNKEELKKKHAAYMQLVRKEPTRIKYLPVERCNVEYWPACCSCMCTYVGDVGLGELEKLGMLDEFMTKCEKLSWDIKELIEKGQIKGHLYQCVLCRKYHLSMDAVN